MDTGSFSRNVIRPDEIPTIKRKPGIDAPSIYIPKNQETPWPEIYVGHKKLSDVFPLEQTFSYSTYVDGETLRMYQKISHLYEQEKSEPAPFYSKQTGHPNRYVVAFDQPLVQWTREQVQKDSNFWLQFRGQTVDYHSNLLKGLSNGTKNLEINSLKTWQPIGEYSQEQIEDISKRVRVRLSETIDNQKLVRGITDHEMAHHAFDKQITQDKLPLLDDFINATFEQLHGEDLEKTHPQNEALQNYIKLWHDCYQLHGLSEACAMIFENFSRNFLTLDGQYESEKLLLFLAELFIQLKRPASHPGSELATKLYRAENPNLAEFWNIDPHDLGYLIILTDGEVIDTSRKNTTAFFDFTTLRTPIDENWIVRQIEQLLSDPEGFTKDLHPYSTLVKVEQRAKQAFTQIIADVKALQSSLEKQSDSTFARLLTEMPEWQRLVASLE